MRHQLACDFSVICRCLLAAGIFHDLRYTNLASSGTHKIEFQQHAKQKATNILVKISKRILSDNKNSDTASYDVTNAMTSSLF